MPDRRIAIFCELQNIYYITRNAYDRSFNDRKLWKEISRRA